MESSQRCSLSDQVLLRVAFLVSSCSLCILMTSHQLSSFSSMHLYADHKKLIKSTNSLKGCSYLQEDLDAHGANIGTYHELVPVLCTVYFSLMLISTTPYTIGGKTIERVSQQKDLGALVSSNLSWSAHMFVIWGKAYYRLNLIRRSIPITCPINIKKHLFLSSLW